MDTCITKAEAALLLPSTRCMTEVEVLRLAAIAARSETLATVLYVALRGIAALLHAVAAFPQRLATYHALSALTDRELRDIGVSRTDIGRIFEPGFTLRPANDAGERPSPRAA